MAQVPAGITDPNMAARYFSSNRINPGELVTRANEDWTALPVVDRPCILWVKEHQVATSYQVASVVISSSGSGYPLNTLLNATGGTFTTPFQVQITRINQATISAAVPAAGGSGYTNGDVLTCNLSAGGVLNLTATVVAGAVTALAIAGGSTGVTLDNVTALATSGGTGTGCTATLTATGSAARVSLTNAGNYTVLPSDPVLTVSGALSLVPSWTALTWGATQPGAGRVIYYAPECIPTEDLDCYRSRGAGIVYLPTPGRWYARAKIDSGELIRQSFILIDAQDPALVARYLSEPGCHRVTTGSITTSAASQVVVPGNRDRTGLLIVGQKNQNISNGTARLGFGAAASNASGLLIGSDASPSIFQTGDQCWKGSVEIIQEATSVAATFSWVAWE